jgi:hypothetical protein
MTDFALTTWANLIHQMMEDFAHCLAGGEIPDKFTYKVAEKTGFVKQAFDTRRINQEIDRNPREGLQHYHRSEPFILSGQQEKINTLSKLLIVAENLKNQFETVPDWKYSYARLLFDNLQRILTTNPDGTYDPSDTQFNYLEQLLGTRYRLSFEQINEYSLEKLAEIVLSKDEVLMKRGVKHNSMQTKGVSQPLSIAGLEGLMGQQFRQAGEKTVERTITITIRDQVIE